MTAPEALVTRFRLVNIRGVRETEVDLRDQQGRPRRRLLIVGRNGNCKTTVLRAIAVGLCDRIDANSLLAKPFSGLMTNGQNTAEIEIALFAKGWEEQRRTHTLKRSGEKEFAEDDAPGSAPEVVQSAEREGWVISPEAKDFQPLVCGYGAGRYGLGPESPVRKYRIADSVQTLFDYRQQLLDPELTLRRLQDFLGSQKYDAVLRRILRVLGLQDEDEIRLVPGGGIELDGPSAGSPVLLEGWADGHRMTFIWLLDVYGWAMRADRFDDDGHVHGILLVDELDQHLHPSLQTRVLDHLTELLPHVQLIATTHSPLVALGARPEELLVLQRRGTEVVRVENPPDFSLYSAEDMLEDERLFDTSPYSPDTEELLRSYDELVAIPRSQRSPSQGEELARLARELRGEQLIPSDDSDVARELNALVAKHGL